MREMKDSGIEWIGKIPSDWTVSKITHILDLTHPYAIGDGDHGIIKADDYTDDGIPYIRVNNLGWATELQLSNVVYITQQQNELIKSSTLKPDDILFAKTGATIGKTAIIPKSVAIANTTSHVGKISVSREHCAKFFYYVLSSYIGYKQFWDFASLKTTRPELSIDEIKQTILISPTSYAEQKAISDHLDLKCKEWRFTESSEPSERRMGDVNADGKFDTADVVLLQKWLLAVPDTKLADWKAANFYNDNRLDVFDLCLMKRKLIYG